MAAAPIDMRRSFDGLCATVIEVLEQNPLEGHLFLFRGKRGDRIKALIWDRNGLAIWYKRLEKGKYRWPSRPRTGPVVYVPAHDFHGNNATMTRIAAGQSPG